MKRKGYPTYEEVLNQLKGEQLEKGSGKMKPCAFCGELFLFSCTNPKKCCSRECSIKLAARSAKERHAKARQ